MVCNRKGVNTNILLLSNINGTYVTVFLRMLYFLKCQQVYRLPHIFGRLYLFSYSNDWIPGLFGVLNN